MVMLYRVPAVTDGCFRMYRFNSGLYHSRLCEPKDRGDGEVAEYPPFIRAMDFWSSREVEVIGYVN